MGTATIGRTTATTVRILAASFTCEDIIIGTTTVGVTTASECTAGNGRLSLVALELAGPSSQLFFGRDAESVAGETAASYFGGAGVCAGVVVAGEAERAG